MKIKSIAFIMVLLHSGLCMAQRDELFHGRYTLEIPGRTDTPYPALPNYNTALTQSGSGPTYPVQMSRHHIIPMNRLITFYNLVSKRNQLTNLSGFLFTYARNLHSYVGSNGMSCTFLFNDLIDAGNLAEAQALGMARPGGQVRPEAFATFEDFYTWLPGNIFIGPNSRSDDPHEGFEEDAHVIVGTATFDTLSRLNSDMQKYIDSDGNDTNLLRSISNNLSQIAARKSMYQLKRENWVYTHGNYKINTGFRSTFTAPTELARTSVADTCSNALPTQLSTIVATGLL
ncbi:hypothetical protein [Serratia fonticola]|uniref:hypothetical protein n=1 Tax=Serratia fonticola TaxID=47917 RepID=UPI000E2C6F29|nr:hypothetical protein [Serratia fonticola]RDL15183.1 hypothetical protein DFO62_12666 [Serratia fonticola]